MAEKEVKIFYKVEGIDGYVTDLNELQQALAASANETNVLTQDTDEFSKSQQEAQEEVEETSNTLAGLSKQAAKYREELNKAEIGSESYTKIKEKLEDVESAQKDATKGVGGFGESLGAVPGPLGGITKAVKSVNLALKAMLANPIVLVIAAVVAAITGLVKAFTSTKEGAEQVDRVLAGLGAAMDVVRDRVLKVGGAIAKFFSGDFAGAFEDAKGAVSGIGDEIVAEAKKAAELTGVLQKLDDKTRDLNVRRAEQNKLIAQTKLRVDDTTLSIEERSAALEEATTLENQLLEENLNLEKERLEALIALADQSDSDAETLDELANQRIKIAQLEEQSLNKQVELQSKRKALTAQQAAIDKAAADEAKRLREEREALAAAQLEAELKIAEELRRKKLDAEAKELDDLRLKYEEQKKIVSDNEELLAELKTQYDLDVANSKKKFDDLEIAELKAKEQTIKEILGQFALDEFETEEERQIAVLEQQRQLDVAKLQEAGASQEQIESLNKSYQDKVTEIEKKGEAERAKLRKEATIQGVQLFSDVLGAFQQLNNARTADDEEAAKKQFENNKKFAIAQALISTGLAVNAALTAGGNPIKLATGAQFVEAGIALVTGLAQVASIRSTSFEGGGGDTGQVNVPTFDPNVAIQQQNEELAGLQDAGEEIIPGQQQAPIKAYVVSTEVQSGLEANQQIENLSRL
jgi:hypothetical protein